jgi:P27 family predicted phage terminase small subunit
MDGRSNYRGVSKILRTWRFRDLAPVEFLRKAKTFLVLKGRTMKKTTENADQGPYGDFSPAARREWRRIGKILRESHRLRPEDAGALAELVRCWDQVQLTEAEIAKTGLTITGRFGVQVENPLVRVAARYRDQLLRYQRQFGLTPGSRGTRHGGR